MTKDEVLDIILTTRVVAVIRMADAEKLKKVVEAIQKGGVRAIEITMTTPRALEVISALSQEKPDGVTVGAGTVLDPETAESAVRAGADFLVSPVTNPEMISVCRDRDKLVAPGALTPTEILSAWNLGADVVKIFPAASVGPKYFKDILGPLPHLRLMPTGGVNLDNAHEFIRMGACCVGIGTALLDEEAIRNNDWDVLIQKARSLVRSLQG